MKREKESGTLLGVGTAYLPVKEIKGEFYVKVSDFNRCMDGIRIEQEADRKHIEQLEEENKKLKSDLAFERTMLDNVRAEYKSLQNVIKKLKDIQGEVKPTQKSKTITVTDEDNRIILEKGEDGKRHSYGGGNVVLC